MQVHGIVKGCVPVLLYMIYNIYIYIVDKYEIFIGLFYVKTYISMFRSRSRLKKELRLLTNMIRCIR